MTRRVVVTGLGAVSPVGHDMPTTWERLLAGDSGVAPITSYDASSFKVKVAAEVKDFVPPASIDAKSLKHMDRNAQFGVAAALEALADAGLRIKEEERERVGVIFGSGGGGMATTFRWYEAFKQRGPRRVSPFAMSNFIADAASAHIAIQTGALGPNYSPTSACATGTNAVGDGFSTIKLDRADTVIVGGSEAVVLPFLHACFEMMGVVAPETEPPTAACRPFDLHRKGFVPGEGGCALVLEELGQAEARGAEIYAEVLGFGSSNDAHDMVASDASARGLRSALRQALREADVSGERVGYVNTHGTATQLNDRVETHAIKEMFGPHAQKMLVSSIKAATGHMMSASGALECAVVALALQRGLIPPTLNYETYDPDCDIDCVPNEAREVQLEAAISTSVGLGGHNAAVLMRRWNGA